MSGDTVVVASTTPDIRKVVQAGDIATVLNTWQLDATAPNGTPMHVIGTSADGLRRRPDGTWALLIDDPGAPDPVNSVRPVPPRLR